MRLRRIYAVVLLDPPQGSPRVIPPSPQVIPNHLRNRWSIQNLKGYLGIDAEFDDFILSYHSTQVFNIY